MSFGGGGGGPKGPSPMAPPQARIAPEVEKAKGDLREQMRRARSRALSQVVTPGLLAPAPAERPALWGTLG